MLLPNCFEELLDCLVSVGSSLPFEALCCWESVPLDDAAPPTDNYLVFFRFFGAGALILLAPSFLSEEVQSEATTSPITKY